ncbi:MAG: hypothetical protein QM796_04730 [Chthoniobacteraceae bacterium]
MFCRVDCPRAPHAMRKALALIFLFCPSLLFAQTSSTEAWKEVGGRAFSNWSGLDVQAGVAELKGDGEAVFRYPDGPKGSYNHGFRRENDSAEDWSGFYGIQFELKLDRAQDAELQARFVPYGGTDESKPKPGCLASIAITGEGWRTITLPWSAFQFDQVRRSQPPGGEGISPACPDLGREAHGRFLFEKCPAGQRPGACAVHAGCRKGDRCQWPRGL